MSTPRSRFVPGFRTTGLALVAAAATLLSAVTSAPGEEPEQAQPADNIGHTRHTHHHNPRHPTEAPTAKRFTTSRKSDIVLPLPTEQDAFSFVVFGDRTGGPVDGVRVLADAVRDTNLLEPDLVMTVGDLINGYNDTPQWLEQMSEFKGIMNELICPWFPVAGNHDVYWRGPGPRPAGEHEGNYEMHFGPLWYAFEHKNCWFIALYSDEGNQETGEKSISKPETQRMSPEQLEWLKTILSRAKDAEHVFLFLHHPRWLKGNYGDDWDKVHKELVAAGNVTAVFAGHIHHMRFDPRDGIEYVTLATVGGHQEGRVPGAGYLHQYHVVTVRKDQVAMAAFPVGEAIDVRELTGALQDECVRQHEQKLAPVDRLKLSSQGSVDQLVRVTIPNATSRTIELTAAPDSADARWIFEPDHAHARVEPGASKTFEFRVVRAVGHADDWFRDAAILLNTDVLMPGHRYALPERTLALDVDADALPSPRPGRDLAMKFDGDDALAIASDELNLPDGPFTIECWMRADRFGSRTGLLAKTEQSDFGIFVNNGLPEFSVFLGRAYSTARATSPVPAGAWTHIAGVFDGAQVRIYVGGRLAGASSAGGGKRRVNQYPLMVGADVSGEGTPVSHFAGLIDGLRVSAGARYEGESFEPKRRPEPDAQTILLANFDGMLGRRVWADRRAGAEASAAQRALVGQTHGAPALVPAE
ncbi:MAG: LamG-like jellyroll fold domain-containing protein [Phycisphaerales bacterium]